MVRIERLLRCVWVSDCLVGDLRCGECNSRGADGIGGVLRLDGKCHETLRPYRVRSASFGYFQGCPSNVLTGFLESLVRSLRLRCGLDHVKPITGLIFSEYNIHFARKRKRFIGQLNELEMSNRTYQGSLIKCIKSKSRLSANGRGNR